MRALVGLGSNEGDRLAQLRSAVASIGAGSIPNTRLVACSRIYETRPIGPSEHPYFNAAMALDTALAPTKLLDHLERIEDAHGRVRSQRWGPRTLDLDLLLVFDAAVALEVSDRRLDLPHPEVFVRDFVMRPLLDLDPDMAVGARRIRDLLGALPEGDRSILRVLAEELLPD